MEEADAVLNLFDTFWSYLHIFHKQQTNLSNSDPQIQSTPSASKPDVSTQLSIPSRSKSDELLRTFSPNSVLRPPLPDSDLSDENLSVEIPKFAAVKKKRFSKSLSELEFEEVKGFMDLGFVFSEENRDSRLIEIIPGLQKLGQKWEIISDEESSDLRMRPYLSEAWGNRVRRRSEEKTPLMNWSVPAGRNEIDMKDSLKCWAHTVASVVK